MVHTVHYTTHYPWTMTPPAAKQPIPTVGRPYTWMSLHAPTGSAKADFWALLDTGADFTVVDSSVASALGIALKPAMLVPVVVASGGYAGMYLVTGLSITVEGKSGKADVMFAPGVDCLLGRTGITSAIQFGIDYNGWCYL